MLHQVYATHSLELDKTRYTFGLHSMKNSQQTHLVQVRVNCKLINKYIAIMFNAEHYQFNVEHQTNTINERSCLNNKQTCCWRLRCRSQCWRFSRFDGRTRNRQNLFEKEKKIVTVIFNYIKFLFKFIKSVSLVL